MSFNTNEPEQSEQIKQSPNNLRIFARVVDVRKYDYKSGEDGSKIEVTLTREYISFPYRSGYVSLDLTTETSTRPDAKNPTARNGTVTYSINRSGPYYGIGNFIILDTVILFNRRPIYDANRHGAYQLHTNLDQLKPAIGKIENNYSYPDAIRIDGVNPYVYGAAIAKFAVDVFVYATHYNDTYRENWEHWWSMGID